MNKRFLQPSVRAGHVMLLAGTIWIVVIAASFVWNWHQVGDSMKVLVENESQSSSSARVAQKIVESLRLPFRMNTHQLIVTASIGIAVYPDDGSDEVALLKNADIAMYQAKQAGRDRYQVFKKS